MSTDIAPNGCAWCGIDKQTHLQRWDAEYRAATGNGWHQWTAPTPVQRRARMLARRASRTATTTRED